MVGGVRVLTIDMFPKPFGTKKDAIGLWNYFGKVSIKTKVDELMKAQVSRFTFQSRLRIFLFILVLVGKVRRLTGRIGLTEHIAKAIVNSAP